MTSRSATPQRDESGRWGFVVDLGPASDGRRRQARRRGFATKKEAQATLDRLRVSSADGTFVEPTRLTVAVYLSAWLDGLATAGRAAGTLSSYRRNVATHLVPTLGGLRLQALAPGHLDALYARLLADGRRDGKGGLSARTVRYNHTILRKALADAVRKGLIARNVADLADPPSARSARAPEMAWWTPAELGTFLSAVAGDELHPLFRLASMTGLRRGEVCGLRWAEVNLDSGLVQVRRQLTVVDGRVIAEEHPKSDHGRRTVEVDESTVATLRHHRGSQLGRRMLVGAGWREGDLVFCGPAGEQLHPESVAKAFVRRARIAGVPVIRFHDLRHTHCAHLIAAGRNPREISVRLGHASVSFTLDRYGHLMPEAGGDAAAAVAALVDGTGGR